MLLVDRKADRTVMRWRGHLRTVLGAGAAAALHGWGIHRLHLLTLDHPEVSASTGDAAAILALVLLGGALAAALPPRRMTPSSAPVAATLAAWMSGLVMALWLAYETFNRLTRVGGDWVGVALLVLAYGSTVLSVCVSRGHTWALLLLAPYHLLLFSMAAQTSRDAPHYWLTFVVALLAASSATVAAWARLWRSRRSLGEHPSSDVEQW